MSRAHGILLIAALCLPGVSVAQSILSVNYPLGMPLRPNCGMALSMGGTGVAVADDHHLMLSNPANLGTVDKTVFSSLVSAGFLNLHDHDQVANFLDVIPTQLGFGFSLGRAGSIAFSLDTRTNSAIKYRAVYDETLVPSVNSLELAFSSNGGISAWQAGWGYSILSRVNVGLSYERVYLRLDQSRLQTTRGLSGTSRSIDSTNVLWRGNGLRFGVMVPVKGLTFGLSAEFFLPSDASYTSAVWWGEDNSAVSSLEQGDFTLQLPPTITGGLSYQPRPEWLFAVDMSTVMWEVYDSRGHLPDATVGRTLGFGVGAQFVPAPTLLSPRYWETMRYRAGFRYEELPASENSEFAFGLGTGLPLPPIGLLDIVAEYGWRNDAHYADLSEEFFRFAIGVNAGRKWTKSSKGSY